MKTDSLFYRLFHEIPAIVLQLAGQSPLEAEREAERYVFRSVELKQTAFRIDGVLLPRDDEQAPVWFVEVQFQPDEMLYHRLFSELLLFVRQNPTTHDWRVLLLFPRRSLEPQQVDLHRELLGSDRVFRVYIEDLPAIADLPLEIALVKLITEPQNRAVESGRNLLQRSSQESVGSSYFAKYRDLIETIFVYKFNKLSRKEIEIMLGIADLQNTRVYQEALEEGLSQGVTQGQRLLRQEFLSNSLEKRFGTLDESLRGAIASFLDLSTDRFLSVLIALSQFPDFKERSIRSLLEIRLGVIPEAVSQQLGDLDDKASLEWLKKAIALKSWDEFLPN